MINTALLAWNSVYSREQNGFDITNLLSPKPDCHRGAVVKELFARADELGSTPGEAVSRFFIIMFLFRFWVLAVGRNIL